MRTSPHPSSRLEGRRALVTGASGRLGRAIALALGRAGVTPIVHYRSDEVGAQETLALLRAEGVESHALAADLSDSAACAELVTEARARLGGLDLLVNNAALFEYRALDEMNSADFERHMSANAGSIYALSLAAGRPMKVQGRGDIINLACVSAARPWPGYIAYSASKAAVVNLTQGFAKALAPQVRVNAVAPGPVLPPEGADPAQGERAVRATLLKRWGTPEDVAAAVLFLLEARYVTGYTLHVDGGRSLG